MRLKIFLALFIFILLSRSSIVLADQPLITIKPEILYPGDIFFIKTGHPSHSLLKAEMNRKEFIFHPAAQDAVML